ncbi:MAG TPA: hypothetical protein VJ974_09090 [Geopsychrobacteraceae bacterium]|nr:hypothetical protein [Geopsychrobacteraceae bacterium]
MVETQVEIGLDENHGLRGKFRDVVHDTYNNENLAYVLLMLRRYEKDLFINQTNADKSADYLKKFDDQQAVRSFLSSMSINIPAKGR